jgi:hypothetical protein
MVTLQRVVKSVLHFLLGTANRRDPRRESAFAPGAALSSSLTMRKLVADRVITDRAVGTLAPGSVLPTGSLTFGVRGLD